MLIPIHPENPQERLIHQVVEFLRNDGVIIYPTDSMYGLGCDINSKKAVTRICKLKGIDPDKAQLSCICPDLKTAGEYAVLTSTPTYKLLKRALPGPYTFILQATKQVPRHFQSRRKTIGIRVIDHAIANAIVKELGNPLLSTTMPMETEDYFVDPYDIFEQYGHLVDIVIDGGMGSTEGSTVLDCSGAEVTLIRQGRGSLEELGIEVV